MAKATSTKLLTGAASIKEICRRIRVARSLWDGHNNRACRGEREKALALYEMVIARMDLRSATFGEKSMVCGFLDTVFQLLGLRGEPIIVAEDLREVRGPDSAPSKIGLDPDLRSKLSMSRRG